MCTKDEHDKRNNELVRCLGESILTSSAYWAVIGIVVLGTVIVNHYANLYTVIYLGLIGVDIESTL